MLIRVAALQKGARNFRVSFNNNSLPSLRSSQEKTTPDTFKLCKQAVTVGDMAIVASYPPFLIVTEDSSYVSYSRITFVATIRVEFDTTCRRGNVKTRILNY